MRLEADDLREISSRLEGSFPGIGDAVARQPIQDELKRSMILETLHAAADTVTVGTALVCLTPWVNSMLRDLQPGQSADEIVELLGERFREEFVVSAQKSAAKILLLMNAVLEHIRKRLIAGA